MAVPSLTFTDPVGPAGAPLLVLGHSLGTANLLWSETAIMLARAFRVTCWELPGHGASAPTAARFSIQELADAVVAHLAKVEDSDFLYAGASIGGTVGLDLALRHPDCVAAVAVISSGSHVHAPAWVKRAATVRQVGTDSLVEGSAERWFAESTRALHPDRVHRALQALSRTDDESYARACEALACYDAREQLDAISVPILAIWGEHDQLVPESAVAEVAASVQNGQLQLIAEAAHASPLEQPGSVAQVLDEFFKSATSTTRLRSTPSEQIGS